MTRPIQHLIPTALSALLLAGSLAPAQAHAQGREKIEDRVARLERMLQSGAVAELVNQQEILRQSLQELRGEIELLRRDLDLLTQQQRELQSDLDRRLRLLETAPGGGAPAPADTAAAGENTTLSTVTPPAAEPPAPPSGTGDEFGDYQAAFSLLKAGRYQQAAAAFESFMQRYPKGRYAPNALYWLGESYYVVRNFDKAQGYFQRVLDEYPDNAKRPDAMLKLGFIEYERGDMAKAKSILEKVVADYPRTNAAVEAERRLERLPNRGR